MKRKADSEGTEPTREAVVENGKCIIPRINAEFPFDESVLCLVQNFIPFRIDSDAG